MNFIFNDTKQYLKIFINFRHKMAHTNYKTTFTCCHKFPILTMQFHQLDVTECGSAFTYFCKITKELFSKLQQINTRIKQLHFLYNSKKTGQSYVVLLSVFSSNFSPPFNTFISFSVNIGATCFFLPTLQFLNF